MAESRQTSRRRTAANANDWLSLGPAARLLGVSDVTLRHWADQGRVRSYRTMGAHRRFSRADLVDLVQNRQGKQPFRENLGDQTLQRLRRKFRNSRASDRLPAEPTQDEERSRLRVLGRLVVELVLRSQGDRRKRADALEEARFIGREYGMETERAGMSASQAIESFLFHRSALVEAVRTLAPADASRDETLDLYRDIAELTDGMLMALVQSYEGTAPPQIDDLPARTYSPESTD
jgi:excisionase family DNA binding protein